MDIGMQIRGLAILCAVACIALPAHAARAAKEGTAEAAGPEEAIRAYLVFREDMEALGREPPETTREVRAAIRLLIAYDRKALARGFVAHSARKTLAALGGKRLPVIPEPPERPRLRDLTEPLNDTVREMTQMGTMLARLGAELTVSARIRQAAREGRPPPARADARNGKRRPVTGHPSIRGLDLYTHIIESTRRLSAGRAPGPAGIAGEEGLERCLRLARLNLRQCLAAARFADEEFFCAGRHGFGELGRCWGKYVDAAHPP